MSEHVCAGVSCWQSHGRESDGDSWFGNKAAVCICVCTLKYCSQTCTWTHRHAHILHAQDHACTHEHTGIWMAMSRPIHAGHGTPEPHQGLTVPEGHVAARPLPGWGLVGPPTFSLAIATNLDQALGHTMLRNPAGQPVPATSKDLVPSEISPRAKPVPKQVPRVPLVSRVCVSSPEHFISLTHSQMPSPCPITVSCHHVLTPHPAFHIPGSWT